MPPSKPNLIIGSCSVQHGIITFHIPWFFDGHTSSSALKQLFSYFRSDIFMPSD